MQAYFSTGKTTIAGYAISDAYGEHLKDVVNRTAVHHLVCVPNLNAAVTVGEGIPMGKKWIAHAGKL